MKRRKVLIGLLLIASLSATMLAGCGDNSSKSTPTASTTVKQDVQKEEVKVDGGTFMMPIRILTQWLLRQNLLKWC